MIQPKNMVAKIIKLIINARANIISFVESISVSGSFWFMVGNEGLEPSTS